MLTRLLALLMLCASAQVARADDAAIARSRELNAAATKAMDAGDLATALQRYQDAYEAYPTPKLHFNLGLVLDKMNRHAEAADELQAFLDQVPNAQPDTQKFAHDRIAALSPALGRLTVRCMVSASTVRLDGVVKSCDHGRWVEPGEHVLEVTAGGYETLHRTLSVPRGDMTVEAPLVARVSAPTVVIQSDTTRSPPRHAPSRAAPIALGVVSGTLVIAGFSVYGPYQSKYIDYHNRGALCNGDCRHTAESHHIAEIGGTGLGLAVVGGIGVAIDIALWVHDAKLRRAAR